MNNAFPKRYGNAKIYHPKNRDGSATESLPSRVIELNGELVPVRTLDTGHYEVYRCKTPAANGLSVEWSGTRWLGRRHVTPQLSKRLINALLDRTDLKWASLSAQDLCEPDEKGIQWFKGDIGHGYIKIAGNFVLIEPVAHCPNEFRIQHESGQLKVIFEKGKLRLKKASPQARVHAYFKK